jgi:hypothetical protein
VASRSDYNKNDKNDYKIKYKGDVIGKLIIQLPYYMCEGNYIFNNREINSKITKTDCDNAIKKKKDRNSEDFNEKFLYKNGIFQCFAFIGKMEKNITYIMHGTRVVINYDIIKADKIIKKNNNFEQNSTIFYYNLFQKITLNTSTDYREVKRSNLIFSKKLKNYITTNDSPIGVLISDKNNNNGKIYYYYS